MLEKETKQYSVFKEYNVAIFFNGVSNIIMLYNMFFYVYNGFQNSFLCYSATILTLLYNNSAFGKVIKDIL